MVGNTLAGIQTITLIVCFISLYVMLNRDMKLQQRNLEFVIFGCVIADIGMLVQVIAQGSEDIMLIGKGVQVIGICVFMISLVALTGFVCQIKVPLWFTSAIIIIDGFVIFAHFMDRHNQWFYERTFISEYSNFQYLEAELGPAGIMFWLVSVGFPGLACVAIIGYSAIQDTNSYRKKDFIDLLVLFVVSIIILALHGQKIIVEFFDPTMDFISWVFCYMVFSKWRYQGIDVVAAAAQTAIDSISGGVITLNQYREIIYYNEAAKTVIPEINYYTGLTIDKLGDNLPQLRVGEKAEISYNGRKYYCSLNAITDENDKVHGYAIMFNDMTEMFNLMERIKEERRRADEASNVKSQFIANISHEIRTPMNAIMGLSDLIIEESRGRKVYDMAVTIKKAANSLLDLVNNILDISKLESGKMELQEEDYSLSNLVVDIMKVMEIPAAQHGLALKMNLDESLPCMLHGDSGKIRQCLINLINNGIKFTNEGYVRVDVSGIRRGDSISLTFMVIDTGVGIKEQDLERLFGAFEQVDQIVNKGKEGSGLGLSITKQLVELMGGVLDVSSIYGAGTTFSIRISQKIANETPISEVKEIVDNVVEEQKMFIAPELKVLLVDDNKVNLMVAKGFLVPYMLQVDTASSGEEAVEAAKNKTYDIILMDHMMPGMDGVEAVRLIREYYDKLEIYPFIVALTANAFGNIQEMFLSHGFNDFVSKPIDKKRLHEVLLKAIPDEKRSFVETVLTDETFTEDDLAELFMEHVDVREAFKQHGCTKEEYVDLLELYVMEGREKIQIIRKAFEDKDWKNYSIHTHGLKSASINIGAAELSEHAKAHEFASKDENNVDVAYINDDAKVLLEEYESLLNEAEGVVKKFKANHGTVKELERTDISAENLLAMVSEAIELSEDFKSKEAAEKIDEILRFNLAEDVESKLSDVRMKYKLYDDDGAESLLHELKDKLEAGN